MVSKNLGGKIFIQRKQASPQRHLDYSFPLAAGENCAPDNYDQKFPAGSLSNLKFPA